MTTNTHAINTLPEISKIEIKHYRQLQAQLLFIISPIMILVTLFLIYGSIALFTQQAWEAIPHLCLFSGLFSAGLYVFSAVSKTVFRLQSTDQAYLVTTLFMRKLVFKDDDVVKVIEGGGEYMLVLANGHKLRFDKTDRYNFFDRAGWRIIENHPWLPFITKKRFPNASFEIKRGIW